MACSSRSLGASPCNLQCRWDSCMATCCTLPPVGMTVRFTLTPQQRHFLCPSKRPCMLHHLHPVAHADPEPDEASLHVQQSIVYKMICCQVMFHEAAACSLISSSAATMTLVSFAGGGYARPEALYFWFYFIFVNSIWIVVPALVMWYSAGHINRRVAHASSLKKFQ